MMMGVDDATLVGAPRDMVLGSPRGLRKPDAVIVDRVGYEFFFPKQPYELGKTLELNDQRVTIAGDFQFVCAVPESADLLCALQPGASPTWGGSAISFRSCWRRRRRGDGRRGSLPPDRTPPRGCTRRPARSSAGRRFGITSRTPGIPVNFGITIAIALVVGTIVAGQTFYIFTLENLKQFGALKAIGVTNWRITGMILLQALMVGAIGYSIGIAMTAAFSRSRNTIWICGDFVLFWQIAAGTGAVVLFIVMAASLMSIRRVLVLEPAVVFRRVGGADSRRRNMSHDHRGGLPGCDKDFGEGENQVRVLRGVDLRVPFGEMTLLVGPSGCGKTTLLIGGRGAVECERRRVRVLGEDTSRMSGGKAVEFRRRNIGFVFQQYNLLPALTAAENAAVPLLAAGVSEEARRWPRLRICWQQLGLGERMLCAALAAFGRAAAAGGDRPGAGARAAAGGVRRADVGAGSRDRGTR